MTAAPLRVLIVSNTYPPADISGVGTLAAELARELDRAGHRVTVLTRVAPPGDPWAVATGGPKLLQPLRAAALFLRRGGGRAFDLVHVHESDGVLVALVARLGRARRRAATPRLVATLQVSYRRERRAVRPVRDGRRVLSRPTAGERLFAWVRAPLLAFLGRLTARLVDAVVAPSRETARELAADYGARVAAVIPNGVALPGPPPAPAAAGGEPLVLFAGRLRSRKAVAVLVEAFPLVLRAAPGARLVLVGDGEQRAALERQAARLGLGEAVRFAGAVRRDGIAAWYAAADVFCLPSTYEGFPLAILEAMAAGLPVVATAVAGVPEAVEDGATGLLVPAEDAAALAGALVELARDPERRRAMGARGRQRVAERFAIPLVAAAYLRLWEGLAR